MEKVIKTSQDYADALARLHLLLDADPVESSELADQVELLALLLSTYEKANFEALPLPTPIEAIRFRMDQMGLVQKDLVKYLGSPSRVSEVLSGKRDLTLPMIRAIHVGLGIPADLLIKESRNDVTEPSEPLDVSKLPIDLMLRRRWIDPPNSKDMSEVAAAAHAYVAPVVSYAAAFKRTVHFRSTRNIDRYAVIAWLARVWHTAKATIDELPPFDSASVSREMMRDVIRLSWIETGPAVALEFLRRAGICVVIEPALPKTYLDGATLFAWDRPVIGLTIRFDRLDNFWFVLLHELAHVALHREKALLFVDDLESESVDDAEREADEAALDAAITREEWQRSPASKVRSRQAAEHLAQQLRISPSIVAGRIRRRYNDYSILNELIGHGKVRSLFPYVRWNDGDNNGT
ncbi:MAG TPA: ImmA/IrrE family metallo-endopeptidase [Thermoanaerobaculia bacterium]|jgi:HTH-type transcriptional regulator/antitoxin HigA|nr:ImmA/IrrE family metallo-endopeptidase [Thermoanaerobaculia bacterium]